MRSHKKAVAATLGGFFISEGKTMKLSDLKSERAKLTADANALIEKSGATAEDFVTAEGMMTQIETLNSQIATAEKLQAEAAKAAVAVETKPVSATQFATARDHKAEAEHNKSVFAGMVGALAKNPGNPYAAAEYAQKNLGAIGGEVSMALTQNTASGGGVLVPANLSGTVIEHLKPQSVVRKMGAVPLPLKNGNLQIPKITGTVNGGYVGKDDDSPVSQQSFGDLQLSSKLLSVLVPISNHLIENAGVDVGVDMLQLLSSHSIASTSLRTSSKKPRLRSCSADTFTAMRTGSRPDNSMAGTEEVEGSDTGSPASQKESGERRWDIQA